MRGTFKVFLSGILLACALPASPILSGSFNIAGTATFTLDTISWKLNEVPFTAEKARVGPFATGSFIGDGGSIVTIRNLDSTTEPVGPPAFAPHQFIVFDSEPTFPTLDINFIFHGIYSNAACATLPAVVGQTCTPGPPDSPINLVNNPPPAPFGPQATATFVFTGVTSDGLSTWIGNFTSQFTVPYQTLLAQLGPHGPGFVTNTFSGTILVSTEGGPKGGGVPEPATALLFAPALLFLIQLRKRF